MAASSLSAWATAYADVSWRPFPLVPGGKRPLFPGWQTVAGDPARLEPWFEDETRNVGVVAGEAFDCFDIEAEHLPALRAHVRAGGYALPTTPIAETGRADGTSS